MAHSKVLDGLRSFGSHSDGSARSSGAGCWGPQDLLRTFWLVIFLWRWWNPPFLMGIFQENQNDSDWAAVLQLDGISYGMMEGSPLDVIDGRGDQPVQNLTVSQVPTVSDPRIHQFRGKPRTTTAMHINGLQHPWRLNVLAAVRTCSQQFQQILSSLPNVFPIQKASTALQKWIQSWSWHGCLAVTWQVSKGDEVHIRRGSNWCVCVLTSVCRESLHQLNNFNTLHYQCHSESYHDNLMVS